MKTLKSYILQEGLLDDMEEVLANGDGDEDIKELIHDFIKKQYGVRRYEIVKDEDGKFVVNVGKTALDLPMNAKSFTNGLFTFGTCEGPVFATYCKHLKNLDGAPKIVKGDFNVGFCENLESLQGGPVEVFGSFICGNCNKLESLKYAPKIVHGHFSASACKNLKSLDTDTELVEGVFSCTFCDLKSLDGAPKIVKGKFACSNNPKKFSHEDVLKYCKTDKRDIRA